MSCCDLAQKAVGERDCRKSSFDTPKHRAAKNKARGSIHESYYEENPSRLFAEQMAAPTISCVSAPQSVRHEVRSARRYLGGASCGWICSASFAVREAI